MIGFLPRSSEQVGGRTLIRSSTPKWVLKNALHIILSNIMRALAWTYVKKRLYQRRHKGHFLDLLPMRSMRYLIHCQSEQVEQVMFIACFKVHTARARVGAGMQECRGSV